VAVEIKSPKEIELMRTVCRLSAETLLLVGEKIRAGMTTADIDRIVHDDTIRQGARPAPLNYKGFPKSVCTSVNDVVCHGIPDGTVLKNGDIVNVDVTHIYEGFHGDTSATFYIGAPSAEARHVVERIRRHTDVPVCVGVGVSTPDQAAEVCEVADGVVVGSALVRRLLEGGGPDGAAEFVGSLRRAID